MNNKKFRKLLRDPKLFFRDMYAKRVMKLKKYLPLKYEVATNLQLFRQFITSKNTLMTILTVSSNKA